MAASACYGYGHCGAAVRVCRHLTRDLCVPRCSAQDFASCFLFQALSKPTSCRCVLPVPVCVCVTSIMMCHVLFQAALRNQAAPPPHHIALCFLHAMCTWRAGRLHPDPGSVTVLRCPSDRPARSSTSEHVLDCAVCPRLQLPEH